MSIFDLLDMIWGFSMISPSDAYLYCFTSRLLCTLTFAPYVSREVKPACNGVRGSGQFPPVFTTLRKLLTGWIPPVIQGHTQLTAPVSRGTVEVLYSEYLLEFLLLLTGVINNSQAGFSVWAALPSLANKISGFCNKSLGFRCFLCESSDGGQETLPMAHLWPVCFL